MTSAPQVVGKGLPRVLEIIIAATGLLLTAPLLASSAVMVAATSRGPVIFRQRRVGRYGRVFTLFKFRTMTQDGMADGPQLTANGDSRITFIGGVLRKSKLDELPQLWNVLKGDMSFVGPRPEVPKYVDLEDPLWGSVLRARPGLTDPVTLRLRNEENLLATLKTDREQFYTTVLQPFKLRGYAEYLDRRSFGSDLVVLWKTATAILAPSSAPPPTVDELLSGLSRH